MANISQHLAYLETTNLIKLAQAKPELEYLFRHTLTQEAAYESLLKADRKRIHLEVGQTLERLYPDSLTSLELSPLLGHHFAIAEDNERAFKYFTIAGDAALSVYANTEAITYYSRALEIGLKIDISNEQLLHLYINRGRALELNTQYAQALDNYKNMEMLAKQRKEPALQLAAITARAPLYSVPGPIYDPPTGEKLLEQARVLARELNDQESEAKILWNLMLLRTVSGVNINQAISFGEKSLEIARQLKLRRQMAYTLNDLNKTYRLAGRLTQSWAVLEQAYKLWQELDNLPMQTDALVSFTYSHFYAGNYDQVIKFSEQAFQISSSINNLWGQADSQLLLGDVYWEYGQPKKAIRIMEEAILLGEEVNHAFLLVCTQANLGWIYGTLGAVEQGLILANKALEIASKQFPALTSWALAVQARLYLVGGNLVEAEVAIEKSYNGFELKGGVVYIPSAVHIFVADGEFALMRGNYKHVIALMDDLLEYLRKNSWHPYTSDVLFLKAKALLALNQQEAARECLLEASIEAKEIGSRRMLWKIFTTLATLETETTEVQTLRQQALEIVEYIAGHTPAKLRNSFLNLPQVREVFNE